MAHYRMSWHRHALHRRLGEYRMRLVTLGVIVGCLCLDPIQSVKAASWTSAKFPGEQSRAVQGCGDIELVTDENAFALSVARSVDALPLSTRALTVPHGLINAMKSGHVIVIHGSRLQPPYNQISLENSRTAIERVEGACASPFQGATRFLQRIGRRIGVF